MKMSIKTGVVFYDSEGNQYKIQRYSKKDGAYIVSSIAGLLRLTKENISNLNNGCYLGYEYNFNTGACELRIVYDDVPVNKNLGDKIIYPLSDSWNLRESGLV